MTATAQATERFVDSSGGVQIAVYEEGNPDGPTIVLVHGWPDSHVLWDGVAPLLADRFRIVRYDNRGVGRSSVPKPISAYTMSCFADDFAAVIDAVCSPGNRCTCWPTTGDPPRMWEYLSRPDAHDHVASFTSVSGPSGDHMNRYVLGNLRRPYRPRRFVRALRQLLRLSYMAGFSIPGLAPLVVRNFLADGLIRTSASSRRHPACAAAPRADFQDRCRQRSEGVPRQLFPHDRMPRGPTTTSTYRFRSS